MAKNMQPIAKRCKKLGIEPSVMGYNKKTTNRNSNGNMRRKKSEYCLQLNEKQKVKFIYGIMEKQFRRYYDQAAKKEGKTGTVLLTTIERRLDNVVFRLGLASFLVAARPSLKTTLSSLLSINVSNTVPVLPSDFSAFS